MATRLLEFLDVIFKKKSSFPSITDKQSSSIPKLCKYVYESAKYRHVPTLTSQGQNSDLIQFTL